MPHSIGGRNKLIFGKKEENLDKALRAGKWGEALAGMSFLTGSSKTAQQIRADILQEALPPNQVRRPYTAAVEAYIAAAHIEDTLHRERVLAVARVLCMKEQKVADRVPASPGIIVGSNEDEADDEDEDEEDEDSTILPNAVPLSASFQLDEMPTPPGAIPPTAPVVVPPSPGPVTAQFSSGSLWNAPIQPPRSETVEQGLQRVFGFEGYNKRIRELLKAHQQLGQDKSTFPPEYLLPLVEESFYYDQQSNKMYFIANQPQLNWGFAVKTEYNILSSVNGVDVRYLPGVYPPYIEGERPHDKFLHMFDCAFWNRVVPINFGSRIFINLKWHGTIPVRRSVGYADLLTLSLEVPSPGNIQVIQRKDNRNIFISSSVKY